ncbi:hypothetical protein AOX55_00002714 [Sinorhizobium fredii CCBAU 25509]|nr:hypothetical protein AOX55_00002714 [Sinorhizobium fredii CCBAU 25509]
MCCRIGHGRRPPLILRVTGRSRGVAAIIPPARRTVPPSWKRRNG